MNEKRRILDLLAQGKVTADEAEQLIDALGAKSSSQSQETSTQPEAKKNYKWLRITVVKALDENGAPRTKPEVNIRVPMALIRAGVKLSSVMPTFVVGKVNLGQADNAFTARLREHGINPAKIDPQQLEEVLQTLGETHIDVDDGKQQIRIFCE